MDTTQKNREETAQQRQPRKEAPGKTAQRPQGSRKAPAPAAASTRKAPAAAGKLPKSAAKKRAKPEPEISDRKRAYGRTKPKKKTALENAAEVFKRGAQKRRAKKSGKKGSRPQQPAPAIIYTQPQAFNRSRFLIQLLTVTAIVAALVIGMSVFFKVENITVSGAEVYSAWAIREASGIQEGDGLLTFGQTRAGALIKANLPYIRTVRFGIKLPDTVNIIVVEEDVVYAVKDQTDLWWLMNSEGRIVEQTGVGKASNYTQILGITVEYPTPNEKAIATEQAPTATDEMGEVIPIAVTGAQKLNTALQILQALEANGVVGDVASVDISRLEDIILWYGSRYQVNLGDSARLDYKIACMNDAILQMNEWQSGILDISFTDWPDKVAYTPFG